MSYATAPNMEAAKPLQSMPSIRAFARWNRWMSCRWPIVHTYIRSTLRYDGRWGLTLALADAGAASNANRNESCDQSDEYFLHWSSPFFTPRDAHFVPHCTVSCPPQSMVHRLGKEWGTSNRTVSFGTQLGVRVSSFWPAALKSRSYPTKSRNSRRRSSRGHLANKKAPSPGLCHLKEGRGSFSAPHALGTGSGIGQGQATAGSKSPGRADPQPPCGALLFIFHSRRRPACQSLRFFTRPRLRLRARKGGSSSALSVH
jgi:hypothetical protein